MLYIARKPRRWITLVAPLLGFIFLLQLLTDRGLLPIHHKKRFRCPSAPGIEDVLVILKTGVTEAREKLPVHARTTLNCLPNYVVFSDFEEEIEGIHVHDVLRNVDQSVKLRVPDFNMYNRLRAYGRAGLTAADTVKEKNSPFGMPNNPGWKLDKWKFLPMVDEALKVKPDAKWYVFMEADTHLVWPNVMAWLSRLDPDEPHYLGTETQIGTVLFGHGGSGFMVSHKAMRMASEHRANHADEYIRFTESQWAGDMVLGKLLSDAGVQLNFSWPLLQNAKLGEIEPLTNRFYRQPWCFPVVGYHHLDPPDVERMWRFDQEWFIDKQNSILLHSDVFRERILPVLPTDGLIWYDWDNLSGDVEEGVYTTIRDCAAVCEARPSCSQYVLAPIKDPEHPDDEPKYECRTFESPRLGIRRPGAQSGWLKMRIEDKADAKGDCSGPQWE